MPPSPVSSDAPLHVVHFIESLGSGGAERALYNVLKHLDPTRIRSTVVAFKDEGSFWVEPIRRLGIEVHSLGCSRYRQIPSAVFRFRRFLHAHRPDLVHTQLLPANIAGRIGAQLVGIPSVSSIQSIDYLPELWKTPWLKCLRVFTRGLDGLTARLNTKRLIAISGAVRNSAAKNLRFPLQRIETIHNGIDFEDLDVPPGSPQLRQELGLPADSLLLMNVGRLVPQKGLDVLIQALPSILEKFPTAHFVSIGSTANSDCFQRLQRDAVTHGVTSHVHFLGERRDIPQMLRQADLFVFPSIVEGLGVALIEAMALGCACVASDIEALAEVVTPGVDGWLVPARTPLALAERVTEALGDPAARARVGRAAANGVRRRFSAATTAAQLTDLYGRVVGR